MPSWSPTEALSFGWARTKRDPGTVLGALIVGFLIVGLPSMLSAGAETVYAQVAYGGREPDLLEPVSLGIRAAGSIGQAIASALMTGGLMLFALRVARGEPYSFGDIFSRMNLFGTMFVIQLLTGLGVMFGMIFLIVPGVILALYWSLATMLAVDKGLDPIEAMKESWRITEGHKLNIFVFWLFVFGLTLLGLCACCVGALVVEPVTTVAFAYIYLRITGQNVAPLEP